jgi:hypothetical protein
MARARKEEHPSLGTDRRHHLGVVVPQQQRTVAHGVADQLVAVEIPLAGALGPGDRDRKRLGEPDVVRDAARQQVARPRVKSRRPWVLPLPAGDGTAVARPCLSRPRSAPAPARRPPPLCATHGRVARHLVPHSHSPAQRPLLPQARAETQPPRVGQQYGGQMLRTGIIGAGGIGRGHA